MRCLLLALSVSAMVLTNHSFAADQTLDRKQIYELRKECGKSAVEFAQRWRLCEGKGTYQNHYNMKLNVCFIHMTASCNSDKGNADTFVAESLTDVNENKDYARYIGTGKLLGDKPALCYAGNNRCKSILEFHNLIEPYMKE